MKGHLTAILQTTSSDTARSQNVVNLTKIILSYHRNPVTWSTSYKHRDRLTALVGQDVLVFLSAKSLASSSMVGVVDGITSCGEQPTCSHSHGLYREYKTA